MTIGTEPANQRNSLQKHQESMSLSTRKILVVDDNRDSADMTAQMLQMYGLEVQVAYGGPEGLAAARANRPSLIFLDIGMPLLDGYQVAAAVRALTIC